MSAVIRDTWLPTALMIVSIVGIGLIVGVLYLPGVWLLIALILVVTPPVWWRLVTRRRTIGLGRATGAGALSSAITFAIVGVLGMVPVAQRGLGSGDADFTTLVGVLALAGAWLAAVPIGAASGLAAAFLQRRWPATRSAEGNADVATRKE